MQALLLLWSINDRLMGRDGLRIKQPDTEWLNDLLGLSQIDRENQPARRGFDIDEDDLE